MDRLEVYTSFSEIPDNREVQYDTPKPAMPLDKEIDVDNPCSVGEIENNVSTGTSSGETVAVSVTMFHNGVGPMCLDAEEFFEVNDIVYTDI